MKKSYRLILLVIFLVSVGAGAIQARIERDRAVSELRMRLSTASVGLEAAVSASLAQKRPDRLARTLRQFNRSDSAAGAAVCSQGAAIALDKVSQQWAGFCADPDALRLESASSGEAFKRSGDAFIHVRKIEMDEESKRNFSLLLVRPGADVDALVRAAFFRAMATALLGALAAFALIQLLTRWVLQRSLNYLVRWTRSIFRSPLPHDEIGAPDHRLPPEFRELTKELSSLALRMRHERLKLAWNASAAMPVLARPSNAAADPWAELRKKVEVVLKGRKLVIVANREPYMHEKKDGQIVVMHPASGVVTALEPIMRLCGGGVWVAHGSGSADREVVDVNNEIQVPPEHPTYTLRRVWLTNEEEEGYYYGFANEGLWPLCHLAYTRPTFRLSDWEMYKSVNQKFADATLSRLDASKAVILVQDYHYALVPKLLRERANLAPENGTLAAIELFWHIPWPNPEAFGICPQYKELLEGMLGADVVGFHTQFHCNNFLETCDRYLEARIDWERFSVTVGNRETLVRSYPISIATEPVAQISVKRREELRQRYGIHTELVALGVDRLDYTKGLVERVGGVERFLEKYPQYIGRFSFVEMGTPSRTHIPSYRLLITEVEAAIARVNRRFGSDSYRPIVLLKGHFDWRDVAEFYQLGRVCLVTSLHDGMNLVAKEYVWSQSADNGVLILSRFTGAARELSEALIINPYSSEEIADALYEALNLSVDERRDRMQRMKEKVHGHNAFHWATDLLAGVNSRA